MIGTSAYDFIVGGISGNTWIGAGGTGIAKVSGTGLVVTGALSANTLFVHQTTAATEAIATIRTAANSAGSRASPLYSSLNFRGYDGVGGAGSLKGSIRVGDMTVDTNAGILTFSTLNQSNTFGERARFGETGNFLIGTTTDIAGTGNLVVAGVVSSTGKITSGGNIQVAAAGDLTWGGNYGAGIPVINGTSGVGFTFYPNGSTSGAVAVLNSTGLAVTGALSSTTGANFATSSGSVGIGTASPSAKLHVSAAGFGAGNALFQSTNSANYITIRGVNGTGINDSAFILFEDGTSSRDAFIGLTGDAATAGYLRFATNGNTERMRLNSTGLTVVSLGTGLVYSNNGLLTSTNPSDARLKTDITDLGYGLSSILALRPVSYKWKSDTVNQGTQYGFIAQEVQTVMPDLVKEFETTEDGEKVTRLGLEKEGIYAALVKAVQELNGLNANLVAELQSVRQRLAALENS
jgi:hypothetical protein